MGAVERCDLVKGRDERGSVIAKKAGLTVIDDLRGRSAIVGDDGSAARHGFDHDHAKRLGPPNGIEKAEGILEKVILFDPTQLADAFDVATQKWCHPSVEVLTLGELGHLGGNPQGHSCRPSRHDRILDSLVRVHAAKERGVAAGARAERYPLDIDAVVDDRCDGDAICF